MLKRFVARSLVPLLALVCAGSAAAQGGTAAVTGVVTDSSGAAVVGVKVTVLNTGTNVAKTVLSSQSGAYRVPFLIFGSYRVTAEMSGFKTSVAANVNLSQLCTQVYPDSNPRPPA